MAHKSYSRVSRVNRLIQEVIAEAIELMDDPQLDMVTITGCDVSADLRHAKVFVSALGDESKKQAALIALEKHKGHLKRVLSSSIRMKFLPDLHFLGDSSIEVGYQIESIISQVHDRGGSLAVRSDTIVEEQ